MRRGGRSVYKGPGTERAYPKERRRRRRRPQASSGLHGRLRCLRRFLERQDELLDNLRGHRLPVGGAMRARHRPRTDGRAVAMYACRRTRGGSLRAHANVPMVWQGTSMYKACVQQFIAKANIHRAPFALHYGGLYKGPHWSACSWDHIDRCVLRPRAGASARGAFRLSSFAMLALSFFCLSSTSFWNAAIRSWYSSCV